MKNTFRFPQLYFRLAMALNFIIPVMDRIGWLGPAGNYVSWGNWGSFVTYTNTLLPFLSKPLAGVMGLAATTAEATIAILFIIGYKIRLAAYGSFILTLIFALCMAVFLDIKAPINYSVFVDSAGSLLLATMPVYNWSLDAYFARRI